MQPLRLDTTAFRAAYAAKQHTTIAAWWQSAYGQIITRAALAAARKRRALRPLPAHAFQDDRAPEWLRVRRVPLSARQSRLPGPQAPQERVAYAVGIKRPTELLALARARGIPVLEG